MLSRSQIFCSRCLALGLAVLLSVILPNSTALAANVDPYIARFLRVTDSIALEVNGQGETRPFSSEDLSQGKQLFQANCINCHVGGATLPDPQVSLSLTKLKGANPPRDNISSLVNYLRKPMTYDGSEETYWCREVPETWLTQEQVESIAAFVLAAAQKAPGWGAENF